MVNVQSFQGMMLEIGYPPQGKGGGVRGGECISMYISHFVQNLTQYETQNFFIEKIIKILEYNVPKNICELEFCKHFLDTAAKV